MPQPRVKAQWDHEEKVLLARAELALVSEKGVLRNINKELAERTSGRTAEAIKKVRQLDDYKEILTSLKPPAHRTHDNQSEESVSPDLVIGTQDGRVEGGDSPEAQAHGMHDGGVDGGDFPVTQASLGIAPSLPSQITPEQLPPLAESQDPVISAMINTPAAVRLLKAKQTTLDGSVVATRQGLRGLLANQLHCSVDGRGLVRSSQVPSQHRWVTAGTTNVRGGAFVNAIKIRGGLVATALRRSRGFPNYDKSCDCCGHLTGVSQDSCLAYCES